MAKKIIYSSYDKAIEDLSNNTSIMIGGFGVQGGQPTNLMVALRNMNLKELTLIGNVAGISMITGYGWKNSDKDNIIDQSIFFQKKQVKKIICSFPIPSQRNPISEIEKAWINNEAEVEIIPQGTLAEKIRAAGSGIPAFYTKTGVGTIIEKDKETKLIKGEKYLLEYALSADVAFIKAHLSDENGNLIYKGTSRAFNPIMASAAKLTIVEVDKIIPSKDLNSERIGTPGIYVDRIVSVNNELS
ncbi:MAG: 3-oxoacid CoA-transferase subunit A [Chloroflexota bacterium]|nr:3-oxoacid CoA-transferase subunit A [Chloroflexota bacterium]